MPDIKMSDPEYWEMPEKFRIIDRGLVDARAAFHLLGPDEAGTPVCAVLELQPGWIVSRHAHPSYRFEIICRGTLETEERIYEAGDIMTAGPGELYGPKVAGPAGCLSLEVFSNQAGATEVLLDFKDGSQKQIHLLDGEVRDDLGELAGLEWALKRSADIGAALAAQTA